MSPPPRSKDEHKIHEVDYLGFPAGVSVYVFTRRGKKGCMSRQVIKVNCIWWGCSYLFTPNLFFMFQCSCLEVALDIKCLFFLKKLWPKQTTNNRTLIRDIMFCAACGPEQKRAHVVASDKRSIILQRGTGLKSISRCSINLRFRLL